MTNSSTRLPRSAVTRSWNDGRQPQRELVAVETNYEEAVWLKAGTGNLQACDSSCMYMRKPVLG